MVNREGLRARPRSHEGLNQPPTLPPRDAEPAQGETTQCQSGKRKRSITPGPAAPSDSNISALQDDESKYSDGAGDNASDPKRARTEDLLDTLSDFTSHYGKDAVMARLNSEYRAMQAISRAHEELEHAIQRAREEFKHDHETFERLHEHRISKMNAGFIDLLERNIFDKTNLADYKEKTAAQIQDRLTSSQVAALIDEERRARDSAIAKSTTKLSDTFSASILEGLSQFQRTILKTTMTSALTPVTDRVDTLARNLAVHQKQLESKAQKMEKDIKKSTAALSSLQLQFEQAPTQKDLQKRLDDERNDRERAISQLTISTITQSEAQIRALKSKLEIRTVTDALDPLHQKIVALNKRCESITENIQSSKSEVHSLLQADEARVVETRTNLDALSSSVEETKGMQARIKGLEDALDVERKNRTEDRKELELTIAALKELRIRTQETESKASERYSKEKKHLESVVQDLRTELNTAETNVAAITVALPTDCVGSLKKLEETTNSTEGHISSLFEKMRIESPHKLNDRIGKLEAARSQESANQITEIRTNLQSLASQVRGLAASVQSSENHRSALQKSVDECAAIAIPIAVDLDSLKAQHAKCIANNTAKAQEAVESAIHHCNQIVRQLRGRIEDHFAFQGHTLDSCNCKENPQSIDLQNSSRALISPRSQDLTSRAPNPCQPSVGELTRMRGGAPRARHHDEGTILRELVTFQNQVLFTADEFRRGVAEDLTDLSAKIDKLGADHENLGAQVEILRNFLARVL